MDELPSISPVSAGEPPRPGARPADPVRRSLLRRLVALLAAGGTAFALTTWMLVRVDNPLGRWRPAANGSPSGVVTAHLEALNRGELRAAYRLFSPHYRRKVSFEAYQRLVMTHLRLFRMRDYRLAPITESNERAVLETHIVAEGGERYLARFTLVRAEGRWWIDDLRWGSEARAKGLHSA